MAQGYAPSQLFRKGYLNSYPGGGYYLVGGKIPVYLKHSTKRKGPWSFNFFRSHQETQAELYSQYGECVTCLICGRDGIVGLSMADLRQVLDGEFEQQECVSVYRKLNRMYQVKGRDGVLDCKLSRKSAFEYISQMLELPTS